MILLDPLKKSNKRRQCRTNYVSNIQLYLIPTEFSNHFGQWLALCTSCMCMLAFAVKVVCNAIDSNKPGNSLIFKLTIVIAYFLVYSKNCQTCKLVIRKCCLWPFLYCIINTSTWILPSQNLVIMVVLLAPCEIFLHVSPHI